MKLKYKILSSSLALSATLPIVFTSVACSKFTKYDQIAEKIKTSCIEEFKELSKNYRETYHTLKICEYLEKWATTNKFTWKNDKNTYKPYEKGHTDSGYNLMFDVPASKDGKNIPPIILQAHTDMVVVGATAKVKERGVKVVEDQNFLHSENFESSLGADNGIGIATMLALAKHSDEFVHGPIRMLFTTDEEDGPSGAAQVPDDWVMYNGKPISYLINCDSEAFDEMSIACGGAKQGEWKPTLVAGTDIVNTPTTDWNQYRFKISGLKGGHSALEINKGKINAIKLMTKLMQTLALNAPETEDPYDYPRLTYAFQGKEETDKTAIGTIPSIMTVEIATKADADTIRSVISEIETRAKSDHEIETGLTIGFDAIQESKKRTKCLSAEFTERLFDFINKMPFGVISYHKKYGVDLSSNIASFKFIGTDNMVLSVEAMIRGYSTKSIDKQYQSYQNILDDCFPDKGYDFKETAYNDPWISQNEDPLHKVLKDGAGKIGIGLKSTAQSWWLEVGAFDQKAKKQKFDIHMASIGVTIHDAHDVKERVDTNTIAPFTKMLLYTLESLS